MAGPKLNGTGVEKLKTLENAQRQLQRVHGLVEQMAMAVKDLKPVQVQCMQIKRAAAPMVSSLKGQFGMISDQVAALVLVAGRNGSDPVRLRSMRESVAQIRVQLEISTAKTIELHTVDADHAKNPA
jgi:hypothetical protein